MVGLVLFDEMGQMAVFGQDEIKRIDISIKKDSERKYSYFVVVQGSILTGENLKARRNKDNRGLIIKNLKDINRKYYKGFCSFNKSEFKEGKYKNFNKFTFFDKVFIVDYSEAVSTSGGQRDFTLTFKQSQLSKVDFLIDKKNFDRNYKLNIDNMGFEELKTDDVNKGISELRKGM